MQNNFFCNNPYINIYERPSSNSKISSQIIYGEKFKILKKVKNFFKIRTSYDKYYGYIKNKNFIKKFKPSHKVKVLKSKIYKSNKFLPFSSEIEIIKKKKNYVMFKKNKWIKQKDITIINKKNKNFNKFLNSFLNCKYKWGGKSFKGIDCSALVQIFLNFNNKFCPRDAKDQVKYFKKNVKLKNIKKNDIIYWKGHVAVALSNKKLIHAYGPMKKTVIMDINQTIKRIERTARLNVIGIKRL